MSLMPRPTAPMVGPGGAPTREWLDYLRGLAGEGDMAGIVKAIEKLQQQVAEIERTPAVAGEVQGIGAIRALGLLADGLVRLDMRELEDAGGGELVKIQRDGYGRVAGTSPANTDDLPEGSGNRYFPEAPEDGRQYARRDGGWEEVVGGSPGGNGSIFDALVIAQLQFQGANATTVARDKSRLQWPITYFGGAALSTAQSVFGGSSLFLDGIDDYCSIPLRMGFEPRRGFTAELFVRFDSLPAVGESKYVLSNAESGYASGFIVGVNNPSGGPGPRFYVAVNANSVQTSGLSAAVLVTGRWYHVALVYALNQVRVYIDGQLDHAVSPPTQGAAVTNMELCVGRDPVNPAGRYPRCWIDEVRVTHAVRYTANFTPPAARFAPLDA